MGLCQGTEAGVFYFALLVISLPELVSLISMSQSPVKIMVIISICMLDMLYKETDKTTSTAEG